MSLKHLCQKMRKLTKSEGDVSKGLGNQLEDAPSDQIRDNLSTKVSTDDGKLMMRNEMFTWF